MSEDLLFHMADVACLRAFRDERWSPFHAALMRLVSDREHNGWKKKTGMTQTALILNHIKKHGSISQRDAYLDYGVQSFTRRIRDIRELGYDLVRVTKKHPTTGQVYSRFSLRGTK